MVFWGLKWWRRIDSGQHLVLYHNFTKVFRAEENILIGDSQLDNLFGAGVLKDYPCKNLAVPGFQTTDLIRAVERFGVDNRAVHIFILVGVNDLRYGRPVEEMPGLYRRIEQLLQEKFPQARQHWIAVLPLLEGTPGNEETGNEEIGQINEFLKSLCDEGGHRFLDFTALLSRRGQLNPDLTPDGLHLNMEGNRLVFNGLKGFME